MKSKWFSKFIGCSFNINNDLYIFNGTCDNTETKSGLPLQYEFVSEDNKIQYITGYKEARQVMGSMIDKYYNK